MASASVIVPCYNQGRYIGDCLHSLFGGPTSLGKAPGQTFADFEVLVVDDASPDGSWATVADAVLGLQARGHRNVYALRSDVNLGTAAALNYGITHARGEYVTPLHADDMAEPWHLASLMEYVSPDRFVYGDLRIFAYGQRAGVWEMRAWDYERAKRGNLAHAGILFPRAVWAASGGYPESLGDGREDWAMTLRLAAHGLQGQHIQAATYLYRREGQGRSGQNHTPEQMQAFVRKVRAALPEVYGDG